MTYTELQKKIARLEAELAEVKEMAMGMKKRADGGGVFKPGIGQEYWCILASGEVYRLVWNYDTTDHDRYIIGNCFPTEQSAEDTVRVLKLIQKARESQDGFVSDWENAIEIKYVLYFDWLKGKVCVTNYRVLEIASTFGFWEDRSMCEQFIDENREEILWFFTEYRR